MDNAELIARVRSIAEHGADWRINEVLSQAAGLIEAQQAALDECAKQLADMAAKLEEERNKTVTEIFLEEQLWWEDRCKELEAERTELITKCRRLEAQLPKEGEWIERDDGDLIWFKCSVCGKNYYNVHVEMMQGEYHHCPNCGSRMRKGEQE